MTVILAALPPVGGYVSLVKVVFMLVLVTPWLMIIPWIHYDVGRVQGSQEQWSLTVILCGAIGVLVWLFLPIYFVGLMVYLVLVAAVVTGYVFWRDARVGPGDKLISVIRARGFMLRGKGMQVDVLNRVKIYDDRNVLIPPPDPKSASIVECETSPLSEKIFLACLTTRRGRSLLWPNSSSAIALEKASEVSRVGSPPLSMFFLCHV